MRRSKITLTIALLIASICLSAQDSIKVVLSVDGKMCRCKRYSVVFKNADTAIIKIAKKGFFIPDTTLVGRGELTIIFGKKQLVFGDFSFKNIVAGTIWQVYIDYFPLNEEEEYSRDPKVKWAYSMSPGNIFLFTTYLYTKPEKISCKRMKYRRNKET